MAGACTHATVAAAHLPVCELAHCQGTIRGRDYLGESDGGLPPTPVRHLRPAAAGRRIVVGSGARRPDRDRGPDGRRRAGGQGRPRAGRGRDRGRRDRRQGDRDRHPGDRLRGNGHQRRLRAARVRGAGRQARRGSQRHARGGQRRDRQAHRRELRRRAGRLRPGRDQADARRPRSSISSRSSRRCSPPRMRATRSWPLRCAPPRRCSMPRSAIASSSPSSARATRRRTGRCTRRSGS